MARYQKPLAVFVHSRTTESATTDDIVQETFIRVYEHHPDSFHHGGFAPGSMLSLATCAVTSFARPSFADSIWTCPCFLGRAWGPSARGLALTKQRVIPRDWSESARLLNCCLLSQDGTRE